ncbi:NAD(P)/FAD-dependent oxidoreductase [Roseateles sp. BYS87W]|uniref:NAD(P)/FAD-dependent oxidoreductase n=1 Tax=Pelomonas baiyunensis TaxID=3299026 RepID=A0ABW7GVD0_9BURK
MGLKIAVVGAGLSGVTTAFELAALGAQVHVFERGGSVAEQASFASNAQLRPWLPGLPDATNTAPLAFRLKHWRQRTRTQAGQAAWTAVSLLGLRRAATLRHEFNIDDESAEGVLVALSDDKQAAALRELLPVWSAAGVQVSELDAAQSRAAEPGLNTDAPLVGSLRIDGGVGNARLFAQQLRHQAQRRGVEFRFHTTVRRLTDAAGGVVLTHEHTPPDEPALRTTPRDAGDTLPQPMGPQDDRFDAVVLCNGLDAPALLGRRLPLFAQLEATVTAPLRLLEAHPDLGPKAGWLDAARGVSVARIGQRVRVTGALRITSPNATPSNRADAFESLHQCLQTWFPGCVPHQQVQQGLSRRAIAADGLPLLGASGRPGVWLNLPTGGHGWGSACGAAHSLAQMIAGQPPAADLAALSPTRLA